MFSVPEESWVVERDAMTAAHERVMATCVYVLLMVERVLLGELELNGIFQE